MRGEVCAELCTEIDRCKVIRTIKRRMNNALQNPEHSITFSFQLPFGECVISYPERRNRFVSAKRIGCAQCRKRLSLLAGGDSRPFQR